MDKMAQDGPEEEELRRAKKSLAGGMILSLEGTGSRMRRMARTEMAFGREIPADEVVAKIKEVTADQVMNLAAKLFDPTLVSTTAIGPEAK